MRPVEIVRILGRPSSLFNDWVVLVLQQRLRGFPNVAGRHLLTIAILVAGIVCLFAGTRAEARTGDAATEVQERRAFVIHRGRHWSWAGPPNWTAAYGTYGITIFGPGRALDLGFSSTFCVPAANARQSAQRYMARQRRQLRNSGVRIIGTSRIRRVRSFGPNYFRQTVRGAAGRNLGLAIFDYEVARYCYQRSLSMGAPRRGFSRSLRVLFRVFNSLAYFGPGHYEDGQGPHERR